MIVVKVEMWPFGDEGRKREIGRTYIANVGGSHDRGDYEVAVCRRNTDAVPKPVDPEGPKATRSGVVTNYPRLAYNMWRLIARALLAAFPEEAGKLPPKPLITAADREGYFDEPKTTDYCTKCGESPESSCHYGLTDKPHDYESVP